MVSCTFMVQSCGDPVGAVAVCTRLTGSGAAGRRADVLDSGAVLWAVCWPVSGATLRGCVSWLELCVLQSVRSTVAILHREEYPSRGNGFSFPKRLPHALRLQCSGACPCPWGGARTSRLGCLFPSVFRCRSCVCTLVVSGTERPGCGAVCQPSSRISCRCGTFGGWGPVDLLSVLFCVPILAYVCPFSLPRVILCHDANVFSPVSW